MTVITIFLLLSIIVILCLCMFCSITIAQFADNSRTNFIVFLCFLFMIGLVIVDILLVTYSNKNNYNVNIILGVQVFILIMPCLFYLLSSN